MKFGLYLMWAVLAMLCACANPIAVAQDNPEPEINETFEEGAIDEGRLDKMLEALETNDAYQKERPVEIVEDVAPREIRNRRPNGFARAIANFFSAIAPFVGYLMIAILIAGGLIVLYYMFGERFSLRGNAKTKASKPYISDASEFRPEAAEAEALLADADALAANGRYAEAVHTLLFRSIAHIQEKQAMTVPRSLTAREIGQLDTLTPQIRDALKPIIESVERGYFGGRETTEDDWLRARASYEAFAFGEAAA